MKQKKILFNLTFFSLALTLSTNAMNHSMQMNHSMPQAQQATTTTTTTTTTAPQTKSPKKTKKRAQTTQPVVASKDELMLKKLDIIEAKVDLLTLKLEEKMAQTADQSTNS